MSTLFVKIRNLQLISIEKDSQWGLYQLSKISNFSTFKDKIPLFLHSSNVYNFNVVAAMLPIMAKLNALQRSECVNTWEFLHSLGQELNVMMILPFKNIFYSTNTYLILKISQFSLPRAESRA